MNAPAKFMFDADFAPAPKVPTTIPVAEHKTRLAEAEARGYRSGFQAAEAEMKAQTERRLAVALERAAATMQQMAQGLAQVECRLEAEAVDVAVAVARKLAPELIAREPLAEIAALVTECFRHLIAAPHVVIRIGDAIYPAARDRLEQISQQSGFQGRLVILADPELGADDCRIEWADGGIARERAAVEAAIAETVKRFLSGRMTFAPDDLKGPRK